MKDDSSSSLDNNKLRIRSDALFNLIAAKKNYLLGMLASGYFYNFDYKQKIDKIKIPMKEREVTIDVREISRILTENREKKEPIIRNFGSMCLRVFITETYEVTKDFCKKSKQMKRFERQSWYQFERLIRNALNHNFRFEFSENDKKLLPVSWKGKIITVDLDGKPVQHSVIDYQTALELHNDLRSFVASSSCKK
jgi:hypothetical protein